MENPNIPAVMLYINELFYLGHFNGRREEFTQQVEEAVSQIYTGDVAYNLYIKNNSELDIGRYTRLVEQIFEFRLSTKLTELSENEKAKRYFLGCAPIRHLKPLINRVQKVNVQVESEELDEESEESEEESDEDLVSSDEDEDYEYVYEG